MTDDRPVLYFDFIDPLSRLMGGELASIPEIGPRGFAWRPLEMRPPPAPLTTLEDPSMADLWADVGATDPQGRRYAPPLLVPWTRKAHELVLHAGASDMDREVRELVFDAYLVEGRDIGRVDVLVELARSAGLDATETKAVLDVDRYEAEVAEAQAAARKRGIDAPPALEHAGRTLRGFHNAAAIRTFLGT
jgi:2-hydroxychromene-2-carboxylate isomerase